MMNLYKTVEVIKDFFIPRNNSYNASAGEDARLLSLMASDVKYIRASNNVYYWYFFASDDNDLPVAKYLLRRNGIKAKLHNSHYSYVRHPILRAMRSDIIKSDARRAFIDSIKPMYMPHAEIHDFEKQLMALRAKLGIETGNVR